MAEINDIRGSIHQNLLDSGCNDKIISECLGLVNEGKFFEMLPILIEHKKKLLNHIHDEQKQIDCLDYLVYRIKRKR